MVSRARHPDKQDAVVFFDAPRMPPIHDCEIFRLVGGTQEESRWKIDGPRKIQLAGNKRPTL